MSLPVILILILLFFPVLLWKIFEETGHSAWMSAVPVLNYYIWLQIIRKPIWWFIFFLIPFINYFMVFLMVVETAKCYKKYDLGNQALAALFPFFYLPYLGISKKEQYIDPKDRPKIKKTWIREWVDAIIFAVIAATIIRMFLVEAYTIPTSSMEKSLLVGDFLFVSKYAYGPKVPNTPLAFPFVHHTMPLTTMTKSYLEWIKLPYYRFAGFGDVQRMDAVVFNYPGGDTVVLERQNEDYYRIVRDAERDFKSRYKDKYYEGMGRKAVWQNYHITARPVDKRENYIKRCVAVAGDTLEIRNQQVYIDGKPEENPEEMQYSYQIKTNGMPISDRVLRNLNVSQEDIRNYKMTGYVHLNEAKAAELRKLRNVELVERNHIPSSSWDPNIFPFDSRYAWNVDNFGPLYIPEAGATVEINEKTLPLYAKIIGVYEDNELEVKDGKIFINGEQADSYTFKYDYYWMMGDNRHNSADSRFWGFVPEDHIVGKAVFVWLSLDKDNSWFDGKIRWNKLFRTIN